MDKDSRPELNLFQIKADILLAEKAVEEAVSANNTHFSKYLRAQSAYHIQQAAEKMIKIQLYNSGVSLDYSKIFKHSIGSLLTYAADLGIKLIVPSLIRKNNELLSSWEAEGRYDIHMVVRTDSLKKYISVLRKWFDALSG